MTIENMSKEERKTVLDDMDIGKLRSYAKLLHVPLARTDKADDIRAKILDKAGNRYDVPKVAEVGEKPAPGWAIMILHRDPHPDASNRPVVIDLQGYKVGIPRGVEIPVPLKVPEYLKTLTEERSVPHPDDPNHFIMNKVLSFPFSVIDSTPGPDPRPSALQKRKEAIWRPKKQFEKLFGHYPAKWELMEAIRQGFIKLEPTDAAALEASSEEPGGSRQTVK